MRGSNVSVVIGLCVCLAAGCQLDAPPPTDGQLPRIFVEGGRSGYVNTQGRFVEIPERNYKYRCRYQEGLAAFAIATSDGAGRWGYMDRDGRIVIRPRFTDAQDFSEGLAAVCVGGYRASSGCLDWSFPVHDTTGRGDWGYIVEGAYGFIDRTEGFVIEPQYDRVGSFSEGLAWVIRHSDDEKYWGYVDKQGRLIAKTDLTADQESWDVDPGDFRHGRARFEESGKFGYLDKTGNKVIPAQFVKAGDFSDGLARVRRVEGGPWAYIDPSGQVAIQPEAERCEKFREGLARVWFSGKVGFIDTGGRTVIQPHFDYAWDFSEGLAAVRVDGLWGFIDTEGRMVIEPQYRAAAMFREGIARVSLDAEGDEHLWSESVRSASWRFIDKAGRFIHPQRFAEATDFWEGRAYVREANERVGLISADGDVVLEPTYTSISSFREGLAAVYDNRSRKAGYIDTDGRVVIALRFDEANQFEKGLAKVGVTGKYGLIDRTGRIVVPTRFDDIVQFKNGLAKVLVNGKYGLIDRTGRVIAPLQYERIGIFSDGLAVVSVVSGDQSDAREGPVRYGYIDASGTTIIPPTFVNALGFKNGLAPVVTMAPAEGQSSQWGLIDQSGRLVVEPKYTYMGFTGDGLMRVSVGEGYKQFRDQWGFIDVAGREVISPRYEEARSFSEGFAAVATESYGDRWGFIDARGRVTVEPKYEDVRSFSEGLAAVNIGADPDEEHRASGIDWFKDEFGTWGYIDPTGKMVIEPTYIRIRAFKEGLAAVCVRRHDGDIEGLWGYINSRGEMVIPPQFDWAGGFGDGLGPVGAPPGEDGTPGRCGFIDRRGLFVIPPIFDRAYPFYNGFAIVYIGHDLYLVDTAGRLYDIGKNPLPPGRQAKLTSPQWRGEE